MRDKIIYWSVVGISLLVILGLLYWVVQPLFWETRWEFYARVVIFLLGIIAFAILRMYNAVVSNTRFLIKVREVLKPLTTELTVMKTTLKKATGTVNKNTESHRPLIDSLKEFSESVQRTSRALKDNGKK